MISTPGTNTTIDHLHPNRNPSSDTTTKSPEGSNPLSTNSCPIPQRPRYGYWKLDKSLCQDNEDCYPPRNLQSFPPGVQINYYCENGYRIHGSTDVYCGFKGRWSETPQCLC